MTREQLEKYHDITVRLKMLTSTVVTDSVNGSSDEYPFTKHPIMLHGVRCDDITMSEVNLLKQQKRAMDSYIDGVTDVRAKTLLDLHYRKGKRWVTVAHETGYSMEANEKYLKRFLKCPQTSR